MPSDQMPPPRSPARTNAPTPVETRNLPRGASSLTDETTSPVTGPLGLSSKGSGSTSRTSLDSGNFSEASPAKHSPRQPTSVLATPTEADLSPPAVEVLNVWRDDLANRLEIPPEGYRVAISPTQWEQLEAFLAADHNKDFKSWVEDTARWSYDANKALFERPMVRDLHQLCTQDLGDLLKDKLQAAVSNLPAVKRAFEFRWRGAARKELTLEGLVSKKGPDISVGVIDERGQPSKYPTLVVEVVHTSTKSVKATDEVLQGWLEGSDYRIRTALGLVVIDPNMPEVMLYRTVVKENDEVVQHRIHRHLRQGNGVAVAGAFEFRVADFVPVRTRASENLDEALSTKFRITFAALNELVRKAIKCQDGIDNPSSPTDQPIGPVKRKNIASDDEYDLDETPTKRIKESN